MNRGNIDGWECLENNRNLLLFAQLVNELLFDYSIPSNKIQTLNSHFLCEDALSAIYTIEDNGVPVGTLTPIFEELQYSLENDIVFKLVNENPLKYFCKNNNGNYQEINSSNSSYEDKALIIKTIYNKYFINDWYLDSLKKYLFDKIIQNRYEDWDIIFKLTKIYITEIVNRGYSPRYIYEKINSFFFKRRKINQKTTQEYLQSFFDLFDFKEKNYFIAIKVPSELIDVLKIADSIRPLEDEYADKADKNDDFFNLKDYEDVIYLSVEALDNIAAITFLKRDISRRIAVYQMYEHNCTLKVEDCDFAFYNEKKKKWFKEGREKHALQKARTASKQKVSKKVKEYYMALAKLEDKEEFYERRSILSAVEFHYYAACNNSPENQLLDMWSIFENLLDISNKHTSDRIEQISSHLIPILKRKYLYSLFQQLCQDIKTYSPEILKEIVGSTDVDKESVKKLCYFVILEEFMSERQKILDRIGDFPLMQERIEYYTKVLSNKSGIVKFVEKHSNMVKWQIMRIYRNRNLIIHNGKSMSYLSLLVENLHNYVDVFLNHIIEFLANDGTLADVKTELFTIECEWNSIKKTNKTNVDAEMIDFILNL